MATEDVRRDKIIAAAGTMFRQRGYSGTTVRDLAKECGITSGSIFHHFGSKEELLLSVVERGLEQTTSRLDMTGRDVADPSGRIEAMIEAHLESLLDGSPETMSVLFHEQWSLSPEALSRMVEMRDAYELIWDRALADLGGTYSDPGNRRLRRLLLLGAMNWSAQWYRPDGELTVKRIAAELARIFLS